MYNLRTDLVLDTLDYSKTKVEKEVNNYEKINVTKVIIDAKLEKEINKKQGVYITLEFEDITDYDNRLKITKTLAEEIKKLLTIKNIDDNMKCLIIGLGNDKSTPDALGPKVIDNIMVTRHLFELNENIKDGIRNVSAIACGVMGETGIETSDIIKSIIKTTKPDFVIAIDALCASSVARVNKTIQMTDTGIHPGSGVGNKRKEISEDTLNIPVIAIGVPTVVDATTIVCDTISYLFKHLSYIKENTLTNKLVFTRKNYLNKIKDKDLNKQEKKEVGGILATLSIDEQKLLINEVLTSVNYNMMVTPKEIDFLIDNLSDVISSSLNNALHKEVTNF